MNREMVMLAKTMDTDASVAGLYMSVKLDGQRCLWDGGISRGIPKDQIPWANTAKDERYVQRPVATGLWSRYGNVINAPAWFLDSLPPVFLDGELYLGRGRFQECRKIISTLTPDDRWKGVSFHVFDMPSPRMVFAAGKISSPNFTKYINEEACLDLLRSKISDTSSLLKVEHFKDTVARMMDLKLPFHAMVHPQVLLPESEDRAKELLLGQLENETRIGGEGMMLRSPKSIWQPKRVDTLLKVKKLEMDCGTILGYYAGKGKLAGMFGALVVSWKNKTFELSGFTDEERRFADPAFTTWCMRNEGERCPECVYSVKFPIGSSVRFTYRTLTDDGIPREARYLRS